MEKVRNYPMSAGNSSDEIDLSLLGLRIIYALQRNFKIFVGIVAVGALLGVYYFYLTPPIYNTSLIASSRILTNIRVENLIQVLDGLAKEGNANQLAKKLNVSLSLANTLKNIDANDVLPEKITSDIISRLDTNVFKITVSTYNNQQLDSLQAGILYFLQHNNFVEKRVAIEKQNLESMQIKVQEEIKKLDSLRFSVNKVLSKGIGANSTMLMLDPGSINKDLMALYEEELKIKSDLLLIDDIQVIQDFTQFTTPVSPRLTKSVAASTGSAITLALIIIALLEIRRGMRKLKREVEQKKEKEKEFI